MEQQFEHKVIDVNIPRKGELLDRHLHSATPDQTSAPLFGIIEFNLSGLCNRKCVFCPRVDPEIYPNVNESISQELYQKIAQELRDLDYKGTIIFSGFGEPLLHKGLETLIQVTKENCPQSRLEVVTNGDLLTPKKLQTLFDAGLDALIISMYDGPEQVAYFQAMAASLGLTEEQVVLRVRWLPPEEDYGLTLSNRSGMVEIEGVGVGKLSEPLKRRCFYPFYTVMVDYDGSVLLCAHDWGKKLIIGNLNQDTLHELWYGDLMKQVRLDLSNANREFGSPCRDCSVDGVLIGRSHFDNWMSFYNQQP